MGKNAGHPMQVPGQCPGRREISPVSLAGYRNKGTSPNLGQDGTTLYKLAKAQVQLSPCTPSQPGTAASGVLAVLPPFPITLPAAKDGTLM